MHNIVAFIFEILGAFIFWMFKGFSGKLENEMGGPYSSKSFGEILQSLLLF
ncbi:MAG: hypothetical protein JKY33_05325 [Bacteroidia bacterium]|nr:hypothetical protein [Bacteroidia bacterium]